MTKDQIVALEIHMLTLHTDRQSKIEIPIHKIHFVEKICFTGCFINFIYALLETKDFLSYFNVKLPMFLLPLSLYLSALNYWVKRGTEKKFRIT